MSKVATSLPGSSPRPLCFELGSLVGGLALERRLASLRGLALSPDTLPWNPRQLERVQAARAAGRLVVLLAGEDAALDRGVAAHLGAELISRRDLTGRFGEGGYELAEPAPRERLHLRDLAKALRVHQWLKNLLLFVPILTAHRVGDATLLARTALGFLAFGLIASSVYVANDLLDLDSDRRHPRKRRRPFASGRLPIAAGLAGIPVLLAAGFALATWISPAFALVLGGYFLVTTGYTFRLKRLVLVDVLCLAGLYVLRIFAGGAIGEIAVSNWLLAFSAFAFLSLALVKRVSELKVVEAESGGELRGRGYTVADLPIVSQIGVAAGQLAVVVLALYVHSADVAALYGHPMRLWFVCALVFFWMSRVWLLAGRGQMHDDPVVFAARDPTSYVLFALTAAVLWWAR
jgi:4-hydroxybenzoate polyprenyltransferase